jgi:hypothetical protein
VQIPERRRTIPNSNGLNERHGGMAHGQVTGAVTRFSAQLL